LNPPAQYDGLLRQVLNTEENVRADRFHFDRDRMRFIAARAQLRMILARYLARDPEMITFSYGPRGKPHIAESVGFNLSHSDDLAVVAVALERNVGVDVEAIRTMKERDRIAGRFFSAGENAALLGVPESERTKAFLRCWTLKEAYVKATGDGLAHPTESFDVAFGLGEQTELLRVDQEPEEASRWRLMGFSPAPNFVGALAVEGHDWEQRRFDYQLWK